MTESVAILENGWAIHVRLHWRVTRVPAITDSCTGFIGEDGADLGTANQSAPQIPDWG